MTTAGDNFVIHQDDDMVLLGTEENLRVLAESQMLFMDGTFKSAPQFFSQLYSIHGLFRGHVVPLVYCLLTSKTRATYYKVFNIIKAQLATQNLQLNPNFVMSDFETGKQRMEIVEKTHKIVIKPLLFGTILHAVHWRQSV